MRWLLLVVAAVQLLMEVEVQVDLDPLLEYLFLKALIHQYS